MNFLARVIAWAIILRMVGVAAAVVAGVILGLSGGAYR